MRIKSLANEDGHFKLECLLLFMLILYGKWLYDLIFMKITATLSQEVILNDLTSLAKKCIKCIEKGTSST